MKFKMFTFIILLNLLTSCEKNMPINPCDVTPCDTMVNKPEMKDSNIVWQYNPDTVKNGCISMEPILYGNTVLFSNAYVSKAGDPFILFNKNNGKLLNLVDDPENQEWKVGSRYQFKNYCVITDWFRIYILDLELNKMINQINLRDYGYEGLPRICGIGDNVFIPVEIQSGSDQEYANTWLRLNILSMQMDEVLTIKDKGTFVAGFESLAFWHKPNGDTVMIFQNRQYDFKHADRRIDMYAYNLTQKKYEWRIDSFTRTGQTSVFPIIVKGDRFYFQGSNEAFCFSCVDGHQIWNRYFPGEGFFRTNAVLAEGKYIMKGESDKMYALDENSGATVWENPNAGHSNTNMIYHNGRVFYETGEGGWGVLRGLRVSNGQVEWTYNSSNRHKFGSASFGLSGIAIDPETNYIYSNDRIFHMCIKLPK